MNFEFINLAHAAGKSEHEVVTSTGEAVKEEAHSGGGLSVDPSVIGFQALNFLVLLLILNKILYKPLVKLLDERQKRIADGVANAERADLLIKETESTREKVLKEARAESQLLVEAGRKSGEQVRGELIGKAQDEAQQILSAGKMALDNEKVKVFSEIKEESADLVIRATEKLLREKLDLNKDAKLVTEALDSYLK